MVRPVFLKDTDVLTEELTVRGLCAAAEGVAGYQSIDGAQNIRGLWRIYPKTEDARAELLLNGLTLNGIHVTLWDKNPFIVREDDGQEIPTTRLTISDIPLSYNNDDIVKALEAIGCRFMSKLIYECDRDEHKRLTRWKTGRRFAYIAIPPTPLIKTLKVGLFEARLYHKEQKRQGQTVTCFKCLQDGHMARSCPNPVRCRVCRLEGHKQGDSMCRLVSTEREAGMLEEGEVADDDANVRTPAMDNGEKQEASNHSSPPASSSEVTGAQNKVTPPTTKKHGKFSTVTDWMRGSGNKKEKRTPASPEEKPAAKAQKKEGTNKVVADDAKNKHHQMDAT